MWELSVRHPDADRYAMFQDDILCIGNLRAYLNACPFPQDGYLNLYTFKANEQLTKGKVGWHHSNQRGLGALGLVFDKDALETILSSSHMVRKPWSAHKNRSWKALDGGIVESFKIAKKKEYIHNPTLLQHQGEPSSIGNNLYKPILSFPGEDFDATKLLSL
jgi:hypothetical protein